MTNGKHSLDLCGPEDGLGAYRAKDRIFLAKAAPNHLELFGKYSKIIHLQMLHQVYQASNA